MFTKKDIKQFWKIRRQLERLSKLHSDIDSKDLQGGCLLGSFLVHCYLIEKGYDSYLIIANGHAYVQVFDTVVDVTATQFGIKKKVWIVNKKEFVKSINCNWVLRQPIRYKKLKYLPKRLHKLEFASCPVSTLNIPKTLYYDT